VYLGQRILREDRKRGRIKASKHKKEKGTKERTMKNNRRIPHRQKGKGRDYFMERLKQVRPEKAEKKDIQKNTGGRKKARRLLRARVSSILS